MAGRASLSRYPELGSFEAVTHYASQVIAKRQALLPHLVLQLLVNPHVLDWVKPVDVLTATQLAAVTLEPRRVYYEPMNHWWQIQPPHLLDEVHVCFSDEPLVLLTLGSCHCAVD